MSTNRLHYSLPHFSAFEAINLIFRPRRYKITLLDTELSDLQGDDVFAFT